MTIKFNLKYYFLVILIAYAEALSSSNLEPFIKWDKSLHIFRESSLKIPDFSLKCDFNAINSTSKIVDWHKHNTNITTVGRVRNNELVLTHTGNDSLINGAYTCQLKSPTLNKNQSLFNTKYIQLVEIHELVKPVSSNQPMIINFSLDFSITQITSQRAIIEFKSLDVNLFHINNSLQLIYSLTDNNLIRPLLRGIIYHLPTSKASTNTTYLVLEGLKPSTNHSLDLYIQTNFNPTTAAITKTSFVSFYTTRTFKTLDYKPPKPGRQPAKHSKQSAFQLINKKLSKPIGANDYTTDEYDYEDEELDYDDTYDYYDPVSVSSTESIINCNADLMDISNQLITINYLPVKANKLLKTLLNKTADLMEFKTYNSDFFQLNNLAKIGLDYATYSDCSKQVNSENLVLSKPLCLFNIAAMWQPLLNTGPLNEEVFAVQTSIKTNQNSFVYVASTCLNKNLDKSDFSLTTMSSSVAETKTENLTTHATVTSKSNGQMFQSLFSNVKIYQLRTPNISQCLVLNENELQFRIEHSSVGLKYMTNTQPVLVYYIEFESSDLKANNLVYASQSETPTLGLEQDLQEEISKKFFIKKEKDVQIVTINFIRGNYKIPQDSLLQPYGLNLKQKVRSRRGILNISKSEPYVFATHVQLLDKNEESNPRISMFKIKIKLFSESSSHSSNFTEIKVDCRHVYNDSLVFESKSNHSYGRYSRLSLLLTLLLTLIILVSAFIICFIIKNKFDIGPEYFLNLKNSILLKSNNRSGSNHNLNSIHSSVLNLKKAKPNNANHYQQQYQLQFRLNKIKNDCTGNNKTNSMLSNNYSYSSNNNNNNNNSLVNIKNPLFSLNYEDIDSIDVDLFEMYVQRMHVDGDFGFVQLYEEITNAVRTYLFSADVSQMDSNKSKNRYSNILAYDHSRVKLICDDRDETCGYINANYVNGYQKPNSYIATQGPMPNTFADFWRMVWEKNCSIVCMITNVLEKGRVKCDQYWPDEGQSKCYGHVQVSHLHTIALAFYTKRIFTVKMNSFGKGNKRDKNERLVYQFHFTDWPDHGVPYYIMPVLAFIKQSSRANPEHGGPIVVHCSAGVGRTGTYIVIDAMMKQIMDKATINIHNFLKHIRHQRNYLVQTEEQFIFIYDVILEFIKSGETELNENNYKQIISSLNLTLDEKSGQKLVDRQFDLITEYTPSDWQISFAQLPYNLDKNRVQSILPVNTSRAILSRKPGVEGSDYINASYLHGCSRQDEFLVTQYPLDHTKSAFWQMVWDNNANQIVSLNSDETEHCQPYWQPLNEIMKCDSFTVILKDENFDIDFVIRDFLLQSLDEDYEFNCRMISTCYWPDSCATIKASFDLVNRVRLFRAETMASFVMAPTASKSLNAPPIIIHDLNGGFRAGTFCALYTFQDLIHLENTVNVYEVAKMFHLKRPGIWQSQSNIMFLYKAVECLFEEIQKGSKSIFNQRISTSSSVILLNNQVNVRNSSLTYVKTNLSARNSAGQTLTLPNIAGYQQNEAHVVSRLYNFQDHIQKNREEENGNLLLINEPSTTVPLNDKEQKIGTSRGFNIPGLPRLLPAFLKQASNNNHQDSTAESSNFRRSFIKSFEFHRNRPTTDRTSFNDQSSNTRGSFSMNRNSRAGRFMNTVLVKGSSFRRVLFPKSTAGDLSEEGVEVKGNPDNPPLIIGLASGSEISAASSENSANAESSMNSKSHLIKSHSASPNSVIQLPDLPETTIILSNSNKTLSQQSTLDAQLTSVI